LENGESYRRNSRWAGGGTGWREKFQEGASIVSFLDEFPAIYFPRAGSMDLFGIKPIIIGRSAAHRRTYSSIHIGCRKNVWPPRQEKNQCSTRMHPLSSSRPLVAALSSGPVFVTSAGRPAAHSPPIPSGHEPENRQAPYAGDERWPSSVKSVKTKNSNHHRRTRPKPSANRFPPKKNIKPSSYPNQKSAKKKKASHNSQCLRSSRNSGSVCNATRSTPNASRCNR